MKRTAVVICPGRGTYNKEELGYFSKNHGDKKEFIEAIDAYRRDCQQITISELDQAENYRRKLHTTGDNASALIYSCALADFLSIDQDKYEIVAVTGNSMGWYLALAAGSAVMLDQGMYIVNTMGKLMHDHALGGQIIFPQCDENWQPDSSLKLRLDSAITELTGNPNTQIYLSIDLGLMSVLAAGEEGIRSLLNLLPKVQHRYPFVLPHHAAFQTPLMKPISDLAYSTFSDQIISTPQIPLVDGRGHIWQPYTTNRYALYQYTFGHQICQTYNYSKCIEVACKEFAPDCLIILGPGSTLGPPTAQQLIKMRWRGIENKEDFKAMQKDNPFILSMGIDEQRRHVIGHF